MKPYSLRSIATIVWVCALLLTVSGRAQQTDVTRDRRFNAVAWMQNAAEYRLAAEQAYGLARLRLAKQLSARNQSADVAQQRAGGFSQKPPAVILDLDETVLDNSAFSARMILGGESFEQERWLEWVKEKKAELIPGAKGFLAYARSQGVKIFFITNRRDAAKPATIANLKQLGVAADATTVLTRNDEDGRGGDKVSRRARVARTHRIVLLIGDSMGDLCPGMDSTNSRTRNATASRYARDFGDRWVLLPNPVYGRWEQALGEPRKALHPRRGSPAPSPGNRAEIAVTVATYNIRFFSSQTTNCGDLRLTDVRTQRDRFGNRLSRLREIVRKLNADIVGLQEIHDRKALELIFPAPDWTLVIDDQSPDCQNLALAVRKPLQVVGARNGKLDAGPQHFLFERENNDWFPGRRDVLLCEVVLPRGGGSLHVAVHHAKSRRGGRALTTRRRVAAARRIIDEIKRQFDDKKFLLLGDFNDNPDDQSLNVLESGNHRAIAAMENRPGPFLINLTEPLAAADQVSYGRSFRDVSGGRINLVDAGSRRKNFQQRNQDDTRGPWPDVLLDQILVRPAVLKHYVRDSAAVFSDAVAVSGNGDARASDHLPVFARFRFPVGSP